MRSSGTPCTCSTSSRRTGSDRQGTGLGALRAALTAMLPDDEDTVQTNRVWVSSWDPALADPTPASGAR